MRRVAIGLALLTWVCGCVELPEVPAVTTTATGTDSSDDVSTTSGTSPDPFESQICADYLTCLAAVDPELHEAALLLYGADGSCFAVEDPTPCETQCRNGLDAMSLLHADEPACGGDGSSPTSTTGPQDPSTTTTDGATSEGSTTGGVDSGFETSGGPADGEDGSSCSQNSDCNSNRCFVVGLLGGICGECSQDADCTVGCMIPDVASDPPSGSFCHQGQLGASCESDAACSGPTSCAPLLSIPGLLEINGCSQCETDFDCGGSQLCEPNLDLAATNGYLRCVSPGSQPDGATCDRQGSGDAACSSGHCTVASVQGLVDLGVCGECASDSDCGGGLGQCLAATFDFAEGATGSVCQY